MADARGITVGASGNEETATTGRYGPLLSAIFETKPYGHPEFITSTPKQARIHGDPISAEHGDDSGDKASPCAKEKKRYGKEWSSAVPRSRRNTSLGSVPFKAFASPSSSTQSLYVDNLGPWFSTDSPSQSSSLDSLASYYCSRLGPPERLTPIKAATPTRKPTICDVKSAKLPREGLPVLSGDNVKLPTPASLPSTTSDPDLRFYNELSTPTRLKSAPIWDKLEKRHQGSGGHSRSHSLASPPSSSLRRRQTTRRHAIYGGTGLPGIPVPFDDPEQTRVNPARATIASFDSTKAVCAISETSFSDCETESPRKDVGCLAARFASVSASESGSPTKPLLTTPIRVRRFFDPSEDDSDLPAYDMSITAVSSSSYDDLDLPSPVKNVKKRTSSVSPLKFRRGDKSKALKQPTKGSASLKMNHGTSKLDVFDHLPIMRELLDLVDEATKSWDSSGSF